MLPASASWPKAAWKRKLLQARLTRRIRAPKFSSIGATPGKHIPVCDVKNPSLHRIQLDPSARTGTREDLDDRFAGYRPGRNVVARQGTVHELRCCSMLPK
ncbi:hypothetical protein JDV02_003416 [Purpureocillium takamizusanense]|uniref:Uncharacterized protein n=1 Tax=Purpureocillium takamizusanense TaxID=2060973 RepID=A0A9Q8QD29_9HYPO|nr:uncharacterized protein JDV02_003416 [Purpureocillium takamizusanense]UNI17037.1 hypothetical protein JDV02_003416 [Purpureocillium takamizusanense]